MRAQSRHGLPVAMDHAAEQPKAVAFRLTPPGGVR